MKKNQKHAIKYQRKQIQISNAIQEDISKDRSQAPKKLQKLQTSLTSLQEMPLEIPRNMKPINIINNLRKKLMTVLEYDQPLLPVDSLFQSPQVCMITGKQAQHNRKSFGKDECKAEKQLESLQPAKIEKQTVQIELFPNKMQKNETRLNQFTDIVVPGGLPNKKTLNYLEIYSQAEPSHLPLEEVFRPYVPTNLQIPNLDQRRKAEGSRNPKYY